jgi:hypothetical protein
MKLLIATSFRPFGASKNNDSYQLMFLNSLKNFNCNLTICATQFDDSGVENILRESGLPFIYNNVSKNNFPIGKKYSNHEIFRTALQEFCKNENNYDFFIYSCSDILLPPNLINELLKRKDIQGVNLIYPNTQIKNGKMLNYYTFIYGIDLIIFRIDKLKAKLFLDVLSDWKQYDWGINEHFLLSIANLLNLPVSNLVRYMDVIKFENNFNDIKEDRTWQINAWNQNKIYLIDFLKRHNLSLLYAKGSYYYLLYKIFNFKDLNLRLLIIYIKVFFYYLPKAFFKINSWKNFLK